MNRERKYNLCGWILFLICAVFFIVSAAISGDMLYFIGSVVFMAACVVFIIPLVTDEGGKGKD